MTETNLTERPEDTLRRYAGILVKIRDIHKPKRIYRECDHAHAYGDPGDDENVINCGDFLTCAEGYLYDICRNCCTDNEGDQTEECADYHHHDPGKPICATVAAYKTEAAK